MPPAEKEERKSQNTPTQNSPYLTVEETAQRLRLKPTTMNKWRVSGDGPPFRMHGDRIVYHIDDIDQWSADQKRNRTRQQSKESGAPSSDGDAS